MTRRPGPEPVDGPNHRGYPRIWLDLDPQRGAAAVWQDGRLMSAARVRGGDGTLDQLHFGLYAPPSLTRGVVRNDDIAVFRVTR